MGTSTGQWQLITGTHIQPLLSSSPSAVVFTSFLYFYLLGSTEISMAVPICNSLTFIFTAIAAKLLGE